MNCSQPSIAPLTAAPALLIDASPVPCFVIDREHRITHWNRSCEQILGVSASSMLGSRDTWRPFYPSARPTMADLIVDGKIAEIADRLYGHKGLARSRIIEQAYEATDFFPHLGEHGRWLFFTAAPIFDVSGQIVGAVETLQDVSAQKNAEHALKEANAALESKVSARTAELATANRQLADSLQRAEELSQLKSDFISMVSHELKTPLNAINGFSELISMDPQSEEVSDYAEEINASGKQLLKLLDNMLQLVEISSGKARVALFPTSTSELLETLIREYTPAAKARGIELALAIAATTPPSFCTDNARLKASLAALLDNAIRYMNKPAGTITLSCEAQANGLRLSVSDNGPGIPPGKDEVIFEQFRQLESYPRRSTGGLGLGLTLARAQIRLLGGELRLERDPQQACGSCFVIELPADAR